MIANNFLIRRPRDFKVGVNLLDYNIKDFGAKGDGLNDDTNALNALNAAIVSDGTITELQMFDVIAGFGIPDPTPAVAWAARPAVAAVGGLGTGFTAVGNINNGGYLTGFEISNKGAGYIVLSIVCNRTSGTATITKSDGTTFDPRLVAGVSVRHESLNQGCTILSRSGDGLTLTLTQNNSYTNSDTFVFGLPWITVGGTPYYDDIVPMMGKHQTVYFPPGVYRLSDGWGVWAGKSNLTIIAEDVIFDCTSVGINGCWWRFCTGIKFYGGKFNFRGSKYSDPYNRTRYSGEGFLVSCCQFFDIYGTEVWDYFDFGFSIGGGGISGGNAYASAVNLYHVLAGNGCGDGIHYTAGSRKSVTMDSIVYHPSDDCFAVVNDGATSQRPSDIVFQNCIAYGGIYRGCVAIGCDRVVFRNIIGFDTHGPFCWAATDAGFGNPSDISFLDITGKNLGNTAYSASDTNSGTGIYADTVDKLTIRSCAFTKDASAPAANVILNINESTITNLDWDQQKVESTGSTATLAGALNTDLDCPGGSGFATVTLGPGRWLVRGTITARSSTGSGSGLSFWPVFYDGTTEYGIGSSLQYGTDLGVRYQLFAQAFIDINSSTKTIRFRIKQSGGGVTIDAGSTAGASSHIIAERIM